MSSDLSNLLKRVYFRNKDGNMGYMVIPSTVVRFQFPFSCQRIPGVGTGGINTVDANTTILLQPNTVVKGFQTIFDTNYDNYKIEDDGTIVINGNKNNTGNNFYPGEDYFNSLTIPTIVVGGSLVSKSIITNKIDSFRPSNYGIISLEFNYYNPIATINFCNARRFENDNRCTYYDEGGSQVLIDNIENSGGTILAPGYVIPNGIPYSLEVINTTPAISAFTIFFIVFFGLFILIILILVGLYSFGKLGNSKNKIKTVNEYEINQIQEEI